MTNFPFDGSSQIKVEMLKKKNKKEIIIISINKLIRKDILFN